MSVNLGLRSLGAGGTCCSHYLHMKAVDFLELI